MSAESKVNVVVVGGGLAAVRASLSLADAGATAHHLNDAPTLAMNG